MMICHFDVFDYRTESEQRARTYVHPTTNKRSPTERSKINV